MSIVSIYLSLLMILLMILAITGKSFGNTKNTNKIIAADSKISIIRPLFLSFHAIKKGILSHSLLLAVMQLLFADQLNGSSSSIPSGISIKPSSSDALAGAD